MTTPSTPQTLPGISDEQIENAARILAIELNSIGFRNVEWTSITGAARAVLAIAAPTSAPTVQAGAPGSTDAERAEWLADKIVAGGDYAKEAAYMLRRWPDGVKSLDDPRLQQLFGDCIEGALAFGFQGTRPPPEAHWLWRFWNIGFAEREAKVGVSPEAQRRAWVDAQNEDDFSNEYRIWQSGFRRSELAHGIATTQSPEDKS